MIDTCRLGGGMALMQLSMHQLLSLPQITGVSLQHLVSMPTPAGLLCSCTFTRSKDLIPLEQEVLCDIIFCDGALAMQQSRRQKIYIFVATGILHDVTADKA